MAIKTFTEQLEEVQAAISIIVSGAQSHSIKDRSYTKADLDTLYQMQKYLMPLATRESSSGNNKIRVRQITPIG